MQILGYTSKAMDLYIGTGLRILEHSKNNTYAEFVFSVIISQYIVEDTEWWINFYESRARISRFHEISPLE